MPDHDAAYRSLFDHREVVEDLIKNILPDGWRDHVDFSTLQQEQPAELGELIDGEVLRREGDRLWKARLKPGGTVFFLLLEFQSRADPWMALRLLVYVGVVWQHRVKINDLSPTGRLPPVVPVVIFNGEGSWTAPTSMTELIDWPEDKDLAERMRGWQPAMDYIMIDENRFGRGRADPGASLIAHLFGFDTARTPESARAFMLRAAELAAQGSDELKAALLKFLREAGAAGRLGLVRDVAQLKGGTSMLAERWDDWERQLQERFKQEGKDEGNALGKRQALETFLQVRLGDEDAAPLVSLLAEISSVETLNALLRIAPLCDTAEEFLTRAQPLLGPTRH